MRNLNVTKPSYSIFVLDYRIESKNILKRIVCTPVRIFSKKGIKIGAVTVNVLTFAKNALSFLDYKLTADSTGRACSTDIYEKNK